MHLRGVKFDDLHSWDDLSLILMSQKVGLPPIKTCTVDLPAGDGELDLTDYFGGPQYSNRTLEFTFACVDDIWSLSKAAQQVLHGKNFDITLDDDPGFYYKGRVSIDDWDISRVAGTMQMTCTCEPYKYKQDVTVVSGVIGADTGRNLILGTSKDYKTATFSGWDYVIQPWVTIGTGVSIGDTLIGRCYVKAGVQEIGLMVDFQMADGMKQFHSATKIQPNKEGYVACTCTVPDGATGVAMVLRHSAADTPEDTAQYKEPKLEKGTTATPWSPAPEDGIDQTLTLTCPCDRMRVIPTITTDGAVNIIYGSTSVDVSKGTFQFTNLIFSEGENVLEVTGKQGTTVSVRYQEGAI